MSENQSEEELVQAPGEIPFVENQLEDTPTTEEGEA